MGKSYSEKVKSRNKNRSGSRDISTSRNKEVAPFPLAPFLVIGVVVILLIAGVVMFSLSRTDDQENDTVQKTDDGDDGNENGQTPEPSPDSIILDTTEGDEIFLEQYRGKVVVLDMFATWCNPCKIQMTELEDLQSRFSPSELVILSIGADLSESMDLLRDFKQQEGADWTFAKSNNEFNSRYPATSIPTMYVIDINGNVAETYVGVTEADVLEDEINTLI